jgi:hypothetical protein
MRLMLQILFLPAALSAQDDPPPAHFETTVFGTTVAISGGLRGDIYYIPSRSIRLPNFGKLKPVGSVYTTELNIGTRSFLQGFPGVSERFEWFAIDYTGRFWIQNPGRYTFALVSDDGSKLYIDDRPLIDNDGLHPSRGYAESIKMKPGWHQIRISYFQGPREWVALILAVAPPGSKELLVFDTDDFLPPGGLEEITGNKAQLTPGSPPWREKRQPAERMLLQR